MVFGGIEFCRHALDQLQGKIDFVRHELFVDRKLSRSTSKPRTISSAGASLPVTPSKLCIPRRDRIPGPNPFVFDPARKYQVLIGCNQNRIVDIRSLRLVFDDSFHDYDPAALYISV